VTALEFLTRLRDLGVGVRQDGDRLRVHAPTGVLTPTLRDELRSRREEILAFLREIAGSQADSEPITPVPRDRPLPLSYAQQRLWFLDQLEPGGSEYNVPVMLRFTGGGDDGLDRNGLDLGALGRALDAVVARHEALRTTFTTVGVGLNGGAPVQVIADPAPVDLPVVELTHLPPEQAYAEAQRLAAEEAARPFDLATGPLLRALVLRLGTDDHVLCLTLHHIVCDEWSAGVLHTELSTLYSALRQGREPTLPPLPVQYADYAVWQRARLDGDRAAVAYAYWRDQLADLTPLDLPTDRPRPAVRDPRGAVVTFSVPAEVNTALAALARRHGATPFMVLLAALQVLLARYTGQRDIAVGTPVAGRTLAETEPLIGFFVNTLVLRGDLSGNPTFSQFLHRVRDTALDAYAHQDLPFEQLVERLVQQRDRGRHPLFQVMFNVEDAAREREELLPGTTACRFSVPVTTTARFDLRVILVDEGGPLDGTIEYRTDLFDEPTVQRLAGHLGTLLHEIARDPDRPVGRLPLLPPAEREQLRSWAGQPAPTPGSTVLDLIDGVIARHRDDLAVAGAGRALNYTDLDASANRLAHRLRGSGVAAETVVALHLPPTTDLIVSVLAVWRAGGGYLALAPDDPPARIAAQLAAAGAALVITIGALADDLPALPVPLIVLDDGDEVAALAAQPASPPRPAPRPGQLAYVVFTSGSTGQPKQVAVTHANLCHYAGAVARRIPAPARARHLLAHPLSVDFGLTATLLALTGGGQLHLIDPARARDPIELGRRLAGGCIDCLKLTPTQLGLLLGEPQQTGAAPPPVEVLILGGEPTPPRLLTRLAELGYADALINHYGPTEATVGATTYTAAHTAAAGAVELPIGRPLPGTTCHVLDAAGEPVPVGVSGELYIGGPGVARGYRGDPQATAERFVPDPFHADHAGGCRLYRTGDRVRLDADGVLHFLGRTDRQLTLHGHRVEPGEVEAALQAVAGVRAAAVDVREDAAGIPRLVAWVVRPDHAPAPGQLRAVLAEQLPGHLVPAAVVPVPGLPLTPNGKIDWLRLPDPIGQRPELVTEYAPPRTDAERAVAAIWADVLGAGQIGRDDDFFELGGHSLLAVQVIGRIREQLGADVTLVDLFDHPTVATLAARMAVPQAVPQ
jgi:amino acid adenylation domain-containing protein